MRPSWGLIESIGLEKIHNVLRILEKQRTWIYSVCEYPWLGRGFTKCGGGGCAGRGSNAHIGGTPWQHRPSASQARPCEVTHRKGWCRQRPSREILETGKNLLSSQSNIKGASRGAGGVWKGQVAIRRRATAGYHIGMEKSMLNPPGASPGSGLRFVHDPGLSSLLLTEMQNSFTVMNCWLCCCTQVLKTIIMVQFVPIIHGLDEGPPNCSCITSGITVPIFAKIWLLIFNISLGHLACF